MSNLETRPAERVCSAATSEDAGRVEVLTHRDVPLGGTRAMRVRRTIPQRARSLVGAWCFLDHYGPDPLPAIGDGTDGMQVPPHPHTGLQTVSWLFAGEILHRDSVGSLQTVRPGELNLMTAGRGISHSEETPRGERPPVLHGVQLWVALPGDRLTDPPAFEHHADLPVATSGGARVQVFLGELTVAGKALRSPATAYTPLVGAQLDLEPGARVTLDVDTRFEHALLVDDGAVRLEGDDVPPSSLGYLAPGRRTLTVEAGGDGPGRAVLVGGEPFAEDVVMWWNFVGRSHDDVARARADWQAQLVVTGDDGPHHGGTRYAADASSGRYGEVEGYDGGPLPAPVLPDVRLRPRSRPAAGPRSHPAGDGQ
ncbi:pirin family protein [Cellulosimicrobium arenosum]|uniref:Pirin family protein n=1 Tax=Cellulosimicrobium arenosum TaxID=2708133 RepID=A0A927IZK5_9MICO|nr:pirin family protein [Cellulosimicrobium arenosum]MBD8078654.1 pirin family protein [Cellulosimicrobium arenosum]